MGEHCTIVMYHYVRELEKTRFPEIKGRRTSEFKEQLEYLDKHYEFIRIEDLRRAIDGETTIPDNSVLLTFDDGYSDHYTDVFPLLDEMGIQGCFYAPVRAIQEGEVLDVNKIHFLLANTPLEPLLEDVIQRLKSARDEYDIPSPDYYWDKVAKPGRYDPKEVIFIKRLFQRELPPEPRKRLLSELFEEHVTENERAFAHELYMTPEQLRTMRRHGMHIGCHSYDHVWLDRLSPDEQAEQIDRSLEFLDQLGVSMDNWTMCYPHGAHDDSLLDMLRERDCGLGLTAEPRVADLSADSRFALPRLDTNDFPVDADADTDPIYPGADT